LIDDTLEHGLMDLVKAIPELLAESADGMRTVVDPLTVLSHLGCMPTVDLVEEPEQDSATLDWPVDGYVSMDTASLEIERLGRFELGEPLGTGGMGQVHSARDPTLRRTVAVKEILNRRATRPDLVARFVAEAQITSQLEHPNIVPVYELGATEDGRLWFAMRKVEGRSLADVLRALKGDDEATVDEWTRTRLLTAFVQVCHAVAYAHSRGVLHRDIKPANVMVGRFGEVLLLDWGLARITKTDEWATDDDDPTLGSSVDLEAPPEISDGVEPTRAGRVVGTVGYMSPEQMRGRPKRLDPRADVFALGATLYELLTYRRAYEESDLFAAAARVQQGPPEHPTVRAPERGIPVEIADLCMRALARDPDDRPSSAAALARDVEAFLDGRRRRRAAEEKVAQARDHRGRYVELGAELRTLGRREKQLAAELPSWASLDEKDELLDVRARLEELTPARADAWDRLLGACEQALTFDADNAPARRLLAEVHYQRFAEADRAGDAAVRRHHERRVRRYDDRGDWIARLDAQGRFSVSTSPPAAVSVAAIRRKGLIWREEEPRTLGSTPLRDVALVPGSYLVRLTASGYAPATLSVVIERGGTWKLHEPVPLIPEADASPDFIYVPAGPFHVGGDPESRSQLPRGTRRLPGFLIGRRPVTMGEYLEFLDALHGSDCDDAYARTPRKSGTIDSSRPSYFERPPPRGNYVLPQEDEEGMTWDARWPAFGISCEDARAYIAWRSGKDGREYRLPREVEWEKAARGADGRFFPWGNTFDATLCKTLGSRPGRPQPEPVETFPTDVSVYGVRDTAGGVREWCGDPDYDGDPSRVPVRGGAWNAARRLARAANRWGFDRTAVHGYIGFRLATDGPSPVGAVKDSPRGERGEKQ